MKKNTHLIYLMLFILFTGTASPADTGVILTPQAIELPQNENQSFTLTLSALNIPELGGFDIIIRYNPKALAVIQNTDLIISDSLQKADRNYIVLYKSINDILGKIRLAVFSIGTTPGLKGNIPLVHINFSVQQKIESAITLSNVKLLDSDAFHYFDVSIKNAQTVIFELPHIIQTLKILCGMPSLGQSDILVNNPVSIPDINRDRKTGIEEAVYILPRISIRQ